MDDATVAAGEKRTWGDRVLRSTAVAALLYAVPLAGAPHLLLDPRLWFVAGVYFILDLAQPKLRADKGASPSSDRNSIHVVIATAVLCQVLPLLDWAYWSESNPSPFMAMLGAAMILGGAALRIWAIVTLGRFFSARVELQPDHQLVRVGPYRHVRHPSYTGALLFIVGVPLFLQTPLSFLACTLLTAAAYAYRIPTEERFLQVQFSQAFEDYRRATKRLIPGVW